MKLTRSTLTIVVKGRNITVQGEAHLRGYGSPDFVVYSGTIQRWDDGSPISDGERAEVIDRIKQEARERGLQVEIE